MEQQYCGVQGRKGKHLTQAERVVIETMLGRHRRTIERERRLGQVQHWDRDWRLHPAHNSDRAQTVHDLNATAKGPELKLGGKGPPWSH
jgi:hypothetical protein